MRAQAMAEPDTAPAPRTRWGKFAAWAAKWGERCGAGLALMAPGLVLAVLYGRRVLRLRQDPAASPGTPDETWIALMVAGVILVCVRVTATALRGRLPRPVGVVALIGLGVAAFMIAREI